MASRRLTLMLSGMIAADPWQGGASWAVLQYLLGLRELGHEVFFIEPISPQAVQPEGSPLHSSANAAYFCQVVKEFGLEETSALLLTGTRQTVGLPYDRLLNISRHADALFNISGMLTDETLLASIPARIYLDLDPAFVQLWHAEQGVDMRFALHNRFVTIGKAIGQPICPVPTCGLPWITTWHPLVLSHWPKAERITYDAFTTVANWRGYGSIEYDGVLYGQKAHSLRPLFSLPARTRENFLLALAIHPDERSDLDALCENGWELADPICVAGTPGHYQAFLQGSKAEFGFAKSGYVASRCGWFSDRSIAYLASGRPVLAQDTGFGDYLPTGEGLFAFSTIEEAVASIEAINGDYPCHSRAARTLAVEYFDSRKVLPQLLQNLSLL